MRWQIGIASRGLISTSPFDEPTPIEAQATIEKMLQKLTALGESKLNGSEAYYKVLGTTIASVSIYPVGAATDSLDKLVLLLQLPGGGDRSSKDEHDWVGKSSPSNRPPGLPKLRASLI